MSLWPAAARLLPSLYGRHHTNSEHPVKLTPDISLHVNGLSMSLGPGLQIGMLLVPKELGGAAQELVQDVPMQPSAFSCAVVDEWLANGVIASIQRDRLHESQRRAKLAASHLGTHEPVWHLHAYNVWLPMKREAASSLVAAAAEIGLKLTLPEKTSERCPAIHLPGRYR